MPPVGLEIAGTVRSVGDGIEDRRVGDRVAAFTAGGGLAEVAVAPAALTAEVPPGVALEVAAATTLVLSTAVLLLADVVRICPGESVLMHSASGGSTTAPDRVLAGQRVIYAGVAGPGFEPG